MNYENGIFIFKGQRRMSSSFIFHLSGRNHQIVNSISTQLTCAQTITAPQKALAEKQPVVIIKNYENPPRRQLQLHAQRQ
jgi:hypothetical protein